MKAMAAGGGGRVGWLLLQWTTLNSAAKLMGLSTQPIADKQRFSALVDFHCAALLLTPISTK